MKKLRLVFMGNPDFAVQSLKDILINSNHEILAIVTCIDKIAGRGQKIKFSPIKLFALNLGIPILQPEKLSSKNFIDSLKIFNADIFVVVAFCYLPKSIWSIPKLGTFNLHPSLLPDYRGPSPINYALINGEKKSGVTTFLINENIDKGKILLQKSINIKFNDTAGSLHDKLMVLGSNLVLDTLNKLSLNLIQPISQPNSSNKFSYKIFKKTCKINWNLSSERINNLIRGLSPYPGAFTLIKVNNLTKIFKIYKGSFILKNHNLIIGKINISNNKMEIYTQDGIYFPEFVQLEGRKKMNIFDFLHGLKNKIIE